MSSRSVDHLETTKRPGVPRRFFTVLMSVILVVGLMPTLNLQSAYADDADDPAENAEITVTLYGNGGTFDKDEGASAPDVWDGSGSTTPAIDANGIYQITSAAELAGFAALVNRGSTDANAVMKVDVDLAGHTWAPIANGSAAYIGTFDGAGHMISFGDAATSTSSNAALFGTVSGTVKDLVVDGSLTVTTSSEETIDYVAGLASSSIDGTFTGCINKANVTVNAAYTIYVGGLIAHDESSIIVNCGNTGNISGSVDASYASAYVGGLVSWVDHTSSSSGTTGRTCIENCYNWGDVSSATTASLSTNYARSGGLVGYIYTNNASKDSYLVNCYNAGALTATHSSYPVAAQCGALSGYVSTAYSGGAKMFVTDCYWSDSDLSAFAGTYGSSLSESNLGAYSNAASLLEGLNGQTSPTGASGLAYTEWIADADNNNLPYFGETSASGSGDNTKLVLTVGSDGKIVSTDYKEPTHTDGYALVGWTTDATGEGDLITTNALLTATYDTDTVYYAKWGEAAEAHTVILDGNDGVFKVEGKIQPAVSTWDGETYSEPDLENSVYQIDSAENLAWFVAYVNGTGEADTTATHYSTDAILNIDINWGDYLWMPIGYNRGSASRTDSYTGTFDGNGHTVTINSSIAPTDVDSGIGGQTFNWGFISVLGQGGTVKDLTIDGSLEVTSSQGDNSNSLYVGGIAGDVYYGSAVTGCVNKADITAITDNKGVYVGGITGEAHGDPTIVNCGNSGNITGETKGTSSGNCLALVGGIVGDAFPYVSSSFGSNGKVCLENCYNWGSVSATTAADAITGAGGIAGRAFTTFNYMQDTASYINNCYSTGTFEASNTDSSKLGAGAIIGYLYTSSTCVTTVSNCYWAASLNVDLPYGLLSGDDNLTVTNAQAFIDATSLLESLNGQSSPAGASGIDYASWVADADNDDLPYFGSTSTTGIVEVPSITVTTGADGRIALADYQEPTRDGYNFVGWNTSVDGMGISYTKDDLLDHVFTDNDNDTLFAQWVETTKFTVTFDSQGGSSVEPQTVEEGSCAVQPDDPTRDGYVFTGWYTDAACTTAFDFATPIMDNIMLFAGWAAIYTVTFDSQGGSEVAPQSVVEGECATRPADPTRYSYAFTGWYTDEACTTAFSFDTPITGDITLYAGWQRVPTEDEVVVTFETNGGTQIDPQFVVKGECAVQPANPERDGFEFNGWFADEACTQPFDFSTPIEMSTIIYAGWMPVEYYITIVNSEGGTISASQSVADEGDKIEITVVPDDGYELEKVTMTDGGELPTTIEPDADGKYTFFMPASDVTITATWKKTETPEPEPEPEPTPTTHEITIDPVDHASVSVDPVEATAGNTVTITVTPDENYTVDSVTVTATNGEEVKVTAGDNGTYTFTMPDSDVTVEVKVSESSEPPTPEPEEYTIAVSDGDTGHHGTITVEAEAEAGDSVIVTVVAAEGFTLTTLRFFDADTKEEITSLCNPTQNNDGTWSFTMPSENVIITPVWEEEPTPEPTPTPEPEKIQITTDMFDVDTTYGIYDGTNPVTKTITSDLKEGTDYTVTYTNNTSAGAATITITGIGDYEGTLTYTFKVIHYFEDVGATVNNTNEWYFDAVYGMVDLGAITGYNETIFGVGNSMTRAELVTIMWRYCEPDEYAAYDEPNAKDTTGLPDAKDGMYYTGAVNWAYANSVITGNQHEDGTYTLDPDDPVTFEQMVTILARYCLGSFDEAADYPQTALDNGNFTDKDAVEDWAAGSMSWAIANGVVTGNDNHDGTWTLSPLEDVARERAVTVLYRSINEGLL